MPRSNGGNVRLDNRLRAEIVAMIHATTRAQVETKVVELFVKRDGKFTAKQATRYVDRAIGKETNLFRQATVAVFEALVGRRANAEFHEHAAESERTAYAVPPTPKSECSHSRHGSELALSPVRFDGDTLEAIRRDQTVFVSVKRVCEALGIAEQRQAEKLKACGWAGTTMMVAPSNGGNQQTFCIDLKSLPMWLAGIHASKVSEAARPKLLVYQLECRDALARHFGIEAQVPQAPQFDLPRMMLEITASVVAIFDARDASKAARREHRAIEAKRQEALPCDSNVVSFSNEQCFKKVKDLCVQKAVSENIGVSGGALRLIIEANYSQIYAELLRLTGINARIQSGIANEKSHIEWCRKQSLCVKLWDICRDLWGMKSASK